MTQPIRRAHYRMWITLAILLPVLFIAALSSRRDPAPRNPQLQWEHYR